MKELWKDIPGFEGKYQASNLGRIKSLGKRYWNGYGKGYIRTTKDRIIGGSKLSTKGYLRVNLENTIYIVHRLIAETWIPNVNNKEQVNHINGIKTDNKVSNLEWVTNQENRNHAVKYDLVTRRDHGNCAHQKLTTAQCLNICKIYNSGKFSQSKIAKKYKVCQQTICSVIKKYNNFKP